jgi:peptidoglycan/LPS O-acetylase OafA/YrhL
MTDSASEVKPSGAAAEGQNRPAENYLSCLQAYRGIAALAVLFYHVNLLAEHKLGQPSQWSKWTSMGFLGVDFFFVLSGFIILYTNQRSIGKPAAAGKYFYRRVTRIYPVFITVFLVKLAFAFAGGGLPAGKTAPAYLIKSLLLIPQPVFPFLDVAWTLSFEMTFYCLFLVLILCGRTVWLAIFAHALAVLCLNLPGMPALPFPASFIFSPYFLEFYLGCAACHFVLRQRWTPASALGIFLAGAACVAAGYYCYSGFANTSHPTGPLAQCLFWGTSFALVVLGSVALGQLFERWIPRALKAMGDASYSIYLMHGNIVLISLGILARHKPAALAHLQLCIVGMTILSLGGSYLYYLAVEKQLLRLFRLPKSKTKA